GNYPVDTGGGNYLRADNASPNEQIKFDGSKWYAKTSDLAVPAPTIYELRKALKLQEYLELNARAGTRYVESILAHFGIHVGDYRADRPVFIGGESTPVVISEILQNSSDNADTAQPLGTMGGHGYAVNG